MEKIKPYLAIYNATENAMISNVNLDLFSISVFENKIFDSKLRNKIIADLKDDTPIVVINAGACFPEFWYERLSQPFIQDETIKTCMALSTHVNSISPLAKGDKYYGTVAELDQILCLLQTPSTIFSSQLNNECFMVRNKDVLIKFETMPLTACNNLLVQSSTSEVLVLTDIVDIGNQKPLPAHPLAALQWQLKKHLSLTTTIKGYPLLDKKPILLHICMEWGGGIHQWINDFCAHESKYSHIVLSSNGELYRQSHGERLTLHYANTQGLAIREFDLQTPINTTCIKHKEYNKVLKSIIEQFQVQQIVVSSLIGHSMECLQTGLPTVRILHDYFPSWPSLIADLEQDVITIDDVDKALAQTEHEPFGLIAKQQYEIWKQALHQIYQSNNVELVAPSQSVIDNLTKIDTGVFKLVSIIPHAISPLIPLNYQNNIKAFQVLVLGRINPPKGQKLLEKIMAELGDDYIFIFLGAGNEGKKYFKKRNIVVQTEYTNNELQELLNDSSPDIALITSQTSETFNYTLSELQQAGICTISTKFGALKDRILDGETGYLCENNSKVIADKVRELRNDPDEILSVRKNLQQLTVQSFDQQISQYRKLFGHSQNSNYRIFSDFTDKNIWAKDLLSINQIKLKLIDDLGATKEKLATRTEWAKQLDKELINAKLNIDLERKEVAYLKKLIKQESKRMSAEIDGLNHAYQNLDKQREEVEYNKSLVDDELKSVYDSRSWRMTRPIRRFTTWARHKRNAIKYRFAQLLTLPTRTKRSLKARGIKATLGIIKSKVTGTTNKTNSNQPEVVLSTNFDAFSINTNNQPLVSIIVPVYNHFEHTYNCLKSLSELKDEASFEIIVVDDCSNDETQKSIKKISGIKYHRQKQNGGFIESCNTGTSLAKGEYLMFLNNDTLVHQGWLDALLRVFNHYSDAGLVGSKLVYPNHQLQEAGGIIFSDASGWNYGRLEDPKHPAFNHVREVDYCSGASILIQKKLFVEQGSFDQRYKPAYYEDTDLAFTIRNIGKKVYYQPASVVTHFEGISSGTDLTQGMKKYQVINQEKFKQKWATQLAKQQVSGTDIELCRIHAQPKRILIFDACTPTPDQDSGSLRMINLIKILKELNYHVVFMPENLSHDQGYTESLQQLGVECVYNPFVRNPIDFLKKNGKYLNVVLLSRYYVAEPVMPFIRQYCPKAQIVFDTVDLHFVRERRMAELANDKKMATMAEITRKKELAVAKACDVTLVVSPYEVGVLADELPDTKVKVLTNIHEVYGCRKTYSQRKDIMFIGGYQHTPNVDAVEWFVAEIFPLIENKLPDLKFHIIGSRAPKHIQEMNRNNIIFHGFVKDIEPIMDDIRIAVAPLRYGAGVKGKVNMSMSYGQPVVGTKVAVEGMFAKEGVDVLMAETPQEFADQIIRLYQDEVLWNIISKGGLANVQKYFSFESAKKAVKDFLS